MILFLIGIIGNVLVLKYKSIDLNSYKPNRVNLCRGVKATFNKCPGYYNKPSDEEPLALEIWGIWITPSLPSLPGTHYLGVLALDWVLSMGQIEQTVCK